MPQLVFNTYGKTRVRLTHVTRAGTSHTLRELSADILFRGPYEPSYTKGDNSIVFPTDTMKNTVYVVARTTEWGSIEELAHNLARHFLQTTAHPHEVTVKISEIPWDHIGTSQTAFVQTGTERRTAELTASLDGEQLHCGFTNLQVLKTADSGFSGFLKDEYTTLNETEDRLFGTALDARWTYANRPHDFNAVYASVRQNLLNCFAGHKSRSVQHTLYAMAEALIEDIENVNEVHLIMPNKHRLLVDLSPFGIENPNQVFVPTDEPSGYIEARVTR